MPCQATAGFRVCINEMSNEVVMLAKSAENNDKICLMQFDFEFEEGMEFEEKVPANLRVRRLDV